MAGVALGGPRQSEDLRALVEQGALRVTIAQRYPLSKIAHAHRVFEQAHPHGSVVIDVVPQRAAPAQAHANAVGSSWTSSATATTA
jgi:hypothetical protein